MSRLVDLDTRAGREAAQRELDRVRAAHERNPDLHATILKLVDGLDPLRAEQIRSALDAMAPNLVLEAFWDDLAPSFIHDAHEIEKPPKRKVDPFRKFAQAEHDDPEHLRGVVASISRFTGDRELVVRAAVAHARAVGIEETDFIPIIKDAIRRLPNGVRDVS